MSDWHVYLLHCADDTFYCGITTNVERRLAEHNGGTGAKYTRTRRPVSVMDSTTVASRSEALRLEIAVKKQPKHKKLAFLRAYSPS